MTNISNIKLTEPKEYINLSNMIDKLIREKPDKKYVMLYSPDINYITIFRKETNNLVFSKHIVNFLQEEFTINKTLGELNSYVELNKSIMFNATIETEEGKKKDINYMLFFCDEMVEEVSNTYEEEQGFSDRWN